MIAPRVGLDVNYFGLGTPMCSARIVRVWSPTCVNLTVFKDDGTTTPATSVRLVQPDNSDRRAPFCAFHYENSPIVPEEPAAIEAPPLDVAWPEPTVDETPAIPTPAEAVADAPAEIPLTAEDIIPVM